VETGLAKTSKIHVIAQETVRPKTDPIFLALKSFVRVNLGNKPFLEHVNREP
jgi:hypothetical protein